MVLEIEIKFPCPDLLAVRKVIKDREGIFVSGSFESNMVFDSYDKSLRGQNILLRLRQAESTELCLKRPPNGELKSSSEVKVWEEYETCIQDPQNMRSILEGLGFFVDFQYEKYREKWFFESCEICLDLLPFGNFVEIEGDERSIYNASYLLGLNREQASVKTYHELNREYRTAHALEPDDSFVFDKPRRDYLIENGLNF